MIGAPVSGLVPIRSGRGQALIGGRIPLVYLYIKLPFVKSVKLVIISIRIYREYYKEN